MEEAEKLGFTAVGIEPSAWLAEIGRRHGLNIINGTLPNRKVRGKFDVILLIDVIEHVSQPLQLLKILSKLLSPKGKCVIITPDASSIFARLLGFRWWHYRIAHISYFNSCNLSLILNRANLRVTHTKRPAWFFSYDYLHQRLQNIFLVG